MPNADTLRMAELNRALPISGGPGAGTAPWDHKERKLLRAGVEQALWKLRHAQLTRVVSGASTTASQREEAAAQRRRLPEAGQGFSDAMLSQLAAELGESIAWCDVARLYLPHRSAVECEAAWTQRDDPRLAPWPARRLADQRERKPAPWCLTEDMLLEQLVAVYGGRDWAEVARELHAGGFALRSPMACMRRSKLKLERAAGERKPGRTTWNRDEDAALRRAVAEHGNDWKSIAAQVSADCARAVKPIQCLHRYRYTLDSAIKRGKWSAEEDSVLRAEVAKFQGSTKMWELVAKKLSRTARQCRQRWVQKVDPSLKSMPWSAEEDARLLAAVDLLGFRWAAVTRQARLEGRSEYHASKRWRDLRDARNEATGAPTKSQKPKNQEEVESATRRSKTAKAPPTQPATKRRKSEAKMPPTQPATKRRKPEARAPSRPPATNRRESEAKAPLKQPATKRRESEARAPSKPPAPKRRKSEAKAPLK